MKLPHALAATVVASAVSIALAGDLSWTYQPIGANYDGATELALAMRTGATWPTVFQPGPTNTGVAHGQQIVANSLTPVGWRALDVGAYGQRPTLLRSASAPNGAAGVVYCNGAGVGFAQSSSSGWQTSVLGAGVASNPETAPSLAYTSNSTPVVAYANGGDVFVNAYTGGVWRSDAVPNGFGANYTRPSVAVDSQDRVAVAYAYDSDVKLSFKDVYSNTWTETSLGAFPNAIDNISFAYGANDVPGMAVLYDDNLAYATFDIQSGDWVTETIAAGVASERVSLVFDSTGAPAMAYCSGGDIIYITNSGAGWQSYVVDVPGGVDPVSGLNTTPQPGTEVGLAFDADDLPVLSYYSQGGLILAYDPPIVTPEPASLLLLGALSLMLRRR